MIKSSPTAVSSFCSVCSQNKRRLLRKWESDSRPYKWESDTEGRNFKSQDQPIAGCAPPQLHAKTSSTPIGPVPKKNVVTAVTSPGPPRHLLYWPRRLWLPVALNRSARPTALPSKPDQMPADNRTNLSCIGCAVRIFCSRVSRACGAIADANDVCRRAVQRTHKIRKTPNNIYILLYIFTK